MLRLLTFAFLALFLTAHAAVCTATLPAPATVATLRPALTVPSLPAVPSACGGGGGSGGGAACGGLYSWNLRSSPGTRTWTAVASSSDGTKLAAVGSTGNIYYSSDSGATWSALTAAGTSTWWGLGMSGDGTVIAAVDGTENIQVSTDSGAHWTTRTSVNSIRRVYVSSDGTTMMAIQFGSGNIYVSTDGGTTWNAKAGSGTHSYAFGAISGDGSKMLATTAGGNDMFISTDRGTTWTDSFRVFFNIAISGDGNTIAGVVTNGDVWTNKNSAGWVDRSGSGSRNWQGISVSSDGSTVVATASGPDVFISNDGGATWIDQTGSGNNSWNLSAQSADGNTVITYAGSAGNYNIYTGTCP